MKKLKVDARELLTWTEDEIWALDESAQQVVVKFDDGNLTLGEEIEVVIRGETRKMDYNPVGALKISQCYWHIQREFPDAPLLKRHHVGSRIYTAGAHLDILTDVYFDTLDHYRANGKKEMSERWMWLLMKCVMTLYNTYVSRLGAYCTGVSVIDFHEVVNHPTIKKVNDAIMAKKEVTSEDIEEAHATVMSVLSDPGAFENNGVNNAIVRDLVSPGQVLQCVSVRGFVEDIDSNIFPKAIRSGFYPGLYKFSDFAKESRSASKSSFFQNRHMGNSEYLNRSIQLSSATLANCHRDDCGNTRGSWIKLDCKDTFSSLLGKPFKKNKDDKQWTNLRPQHKSMVGESIFVRSLFGCNHADRYGVCSACVGDMADSFVNGTSIGWVAGAGVFGKGGQLLLSVKHNDGSVSAILIDLDPATTQYIRATDNPQHLKLSPTLKGKHPRLIVRRKDFGSLHHVLNTDDVRKLMPSNLATMEMVKFVTKEDDGETVAPINLAALAHKASFTFEALEYISKHAWSLTDKGDAEIDLSEWDFSKPFFLLPLKHHSMVEQLGGMRRAVLGSQEARSGSAYRLMDFDTPEAATVFLMDLCSPKMPGTNYALLEIIVASLIAEDPDRGDYRLANPLSGGRIIPHRDALFNRSLAPMMAFERHHMFFADPRSYLNDKRGWSPMDMLLMHELADGVEPIGPPT